MLQVIFSSHGEKAFEALPKEIQQKVVAELDLLVEDSQWYRRVKKLGGSSDRYRFRVGRWRVLFQLKRNVVEIVDIFMKKGRSDYQRRA